jgi:high-affinity K+ transport system ATPase subunit B
MTTRNKQQQIDTLKNAGDMTAKAEESKAKMMHEAYQKSLERDHDSQNKIVDIAHKGYESSASREHQTQHKNMDMTHQQYQSTLDRDHQARQAKAQPKKPKKGEE